MSLKMRKGQLERTKEQQQNNAPIDTKNQWSCMLSGYSENRKGAGLQSYCSILENQQQLLNSGNKTLVKRRMIKLWNKRDGIF